MNRKAKKLYAISGISSSGGMKAPRYGRRSGGMNTVLSDIGWLLALNGGTMPKPHSPR
jgi:hypothetical protein